MPKRSRAEALPELKYIDGNQPKFALTSTGFVFSSVLSTIGVGTGASARVGNKVFVKGLQFRVLVSGVSTVAHPNGATVRFGVYHNKEANGSLPTAANVFADPAKIQSCRNTPFAPKFRILDDNMHTIIQHGTATPTSGPPVVLDIYVPVNKVVDYVGSTGTIADLLKDDYGVFYATNVANAVTLDVSAKVRFSDA